NRIFPHLQEKVFNIALFASTMAASRPAIEDAGEREEVTRDLLEAMMKDLETFIKVRLATRSKGRPKGTTKPEATKARERTALAKKIKETIQALYSSKGKMPTKTAVAKALGIGGINPNTGSDSSLTAFNNKLKSLELSYDVVKKEIEQKLNK
nr:hypothetical protein [Acidobacteriota bacterium]